VRANIPEALRQRVMERAAGRCEYCHKPSVSFFPHEVDHVVALKHGGLTAEDNLALACFPCNRFKGSDLSSVDPQTGEITPLFNPRAQVWADHFHIERGMIIPRTPQGRATVFLLHFNDRARVEERLALEVTQ
jgi:hypothetical protein